MSTSSTFTIYNASAGSGKTFAVVKNYLKILFKSKHPLAFKSVLALTFTNKAVGEMKERIVDTLKEFSDPRIIENQSSMFRILTEELEIGPENLHKKSNDILHSIVHNYAYFDVSTIDRFNHKLIRTFAHDLNLSLNFEVELDTIEVLDKAVEKLIDKAGTDDELTKILVDFAIEKADDDKSWDISYDFNTIAILLIDENEIPFIETLKDKSVDDFVSLKKHVSKQLNIIEKNIASIGQETLELIVNNGLQFEDFSNSYLPKHFQKLVDRNFDVNFNLKWQSDLMEGSSLYPKRVSKNAASIIDSIQAELLTYFNTSKAKILEYSFLKNVYKNITPLSVLNEINNALQGLKEEDNFLLISEFNTIIGNEINKQPVPFIYERIGEKFKHYFIDEFQDTSVLQWNNLIPLINDALSGENIKGEKGSLLLVGDAKQAIYRWRGGKAEQFINLFSKKEEPLIIKQHVENLPINYRSSKAIVDFNNTFFKHLSGSVFSNLEHQNIFENSWQEYHSDEEGYVELSFLDTSTDDKELLYCEKVLDTINKVRAQGHNLGDICVITRKTKEGIAIAEFLSHQNMPIVSSETLMLQNSPEINFIVNFLTLVEQPKNDRVKIELLSYLAEYRLHLEDKHEFFLSHVHLDLQSLFKSLEEYDICFDIDVFVQSPLYEAIETIIRDFHLDKTSNAYIQFFLDEVLEYSLSNKNDYSGFLNFWNLKKDKLSIVSPANRDAVQIMTIHKSKGLEFPVVIFPYANQEIYFDINPMVWFPVDEKDFNGFPYVYINLNKDLEDYNPLGYIIYNDYRSKLELDSINLLYVVLTRAIEQLYIISELDFDKDGNEKQKLYSGLFINYLKDRQIWNGDQLKYHFGNPKTVLAKNENEKSILQTQFISISRKEHNLNILTRAGYLWDTAQAKAIEKGNLIHLILSQIKTENDINFVFDSFTNSGKINLHQRIELELIVREIVTHNQISPYFKSGLLIYNEKDIITAQGQILRPDRIVINSNNEAVILDYKTGAEDPKHLQQLLIYSDILEEMDFKVIKKILVYVNDGIQIKEF